MGIIVTCGPFFPFPFRPVSTLPATPPATPSSPHPSLPFPSLRQMSTKPLLHMFEPFCRWIPEVLPTGRGERVRLQVRYG